LRPLQDLFSFLRLKEPPVTCIVSKMIEEFTTISVCIYDSCGSPLEDRSWLSYTQLPVSKQEQLRSAYAFPTHFYMEYDQQ